MITECGFSEAYSSYGPGCYIKCAHGYQYADLMLSDVHDWPKELVKNMYKATYILEKYGTTLSSAINQSSCLHATLHYYCCYSASELIRIQQFLNNYT